MGIHSSATSVWVQILLFISTTSPVDIQLWWKCRAQEFKGDFTKGFSGARSPAKISPLTWDVGRMQFRSQGPSLPHPALGALKKSFRASLKTETLLYTAIKNNRFFSCVFLRKKPAIFFMSEANSTFQHNHSDQEIEWYFIPVGSMTLEDGKALLHQIKYTEAQWNTPGVMHVL